MNNKKNPIQITVLLLFNVAVMCLKVGQTKF